MLVRVAIVLPISLPPSMFPLITQLLPLWSLRSFWSTLSISYFKPLLFVDLLLKGHFPQKLWWLDMHLIECFAQISPKNLFPVNPEKHLKIVLLSCSLHINLAC